MNTPLMRLATFALAFRSSLTLPGGGQLGHYRSFLELRYRREDLPDKDGCGRVLGEIIGAVVRMRVMP